METVNNKEANQKIDDFKEQIDGNIKYTEKTCRIWRNRTFYLGQH